MQEGKTTGESREAFTEKVRAVYELMRIRDAAGDFIGEHRRLFPLADSSNPEYEFKVEDRAGWEALQNVPQFRDLIAEEQSIFTGGASPQEVARYSSVYQRAYERFEKLIDQIFNVDPRVRSAARHIMRVRGGVSWDALDKNVIDNMVDEKFVEREADKQASAELHEFWDLMSWTNSAVEGMKAKLVLASQTRASKTRGFLSPEDMWAADLGEMKEFKRRVGDKRFQELTRSSNSTYGFEEKKLVEGEEK